MFFFCLLFFPLISLSLGLLHTVFLTCTLAFFCHVLFAPCFPFLLSCISSSIYPLLVFRFPGIPPSSYQTNTRSRIPHLPLASGKKWRPTLLFFYHGHYQTTRPFFPTTCIIAQRSTWGLVTQLKLYSPHSGGL